VSVVIGRGRLGWDVGGRAGRIGVPAEAPAAQEWVCVTGRRFSAPVDGNANGDLKGGATSRCRPRRTAFPGTEAVVPSRNYTTPDAGRRSGYRDPSRPPPAFPNRSGPSHYPTRPPSALRPCGDRELRARRGGRRLAAEARQAIWVGVICLEKERL